MSTIVQIGKADKPGDQIVHPLLKTAEVQREVGRVGINDTYMNKVVNTITLIDNAYIHPKTLIMYGGNVHRVRSISVEQSVTKDNISSNTTIVTERGYDEIT